MSEALRYGEFRRRAGDMVTKDGTFSPRTGEIAAHWCSACGQGLDRFGPGPNGRPNAACPHCRSLERHRFLALLLEGLAPVISLSDAVLDVAPTPQIERVLRRLCPRYVRMDVDPAADPRSVDVQASLTAAPFPDGTFDVILCYHVLEHVVDDVSAMRELRRLLAPGGFALIQVPWRPGAPTDEDPTVPPVERARRFGQANHVRTYGSDFEDRLLAAGLHVSRLTPLDVLGDALVRALGLKGDESVWVARRARVDDSVGRGGGRPGAIEPLSVWAPGDVLRLTMARHAESQDEQIARLEARLRAAEPAARRYREIRHMLPVRLSAAVSRPIRRWRRRR